MTVKALWDNRLEVGLGWEVVLIICVEVSTRPDFTGDAFDVLFDHNTPATTQLLSITWTRSESRGSSGAIAAECHFMSSSALVRCNLWLAQARCADKHGVLRTRASLWNVELLRSVSACESYFEDNHKVRLTVKSEPYLNPTPTCIVAVDFSHFTVHVCTCYSYSAGHVNYCRHHHRLHTQYDAIWPVFCISKTVFIQRLKVLFL